MNLRISLFAAAAASALVVPAQGQRAIGVDVSDWQGPNINWNTAAKPVAQGGAGISFAFIRASRGGTTGTYDEVAKTGTLSQRYDDLYLTKNMTGTKAAGILAGTYHFARPDISTNTGADEATHFLQTAGIYMRPGYLRPVLDLEAGSSRSRTALTDFALEFSDTIFNATGVRPLVYINSSYATDEVDARINTHDLWIARWVDTSVVNVQTVVDPPAAGGSYPNVYGVWNPTYPTMPAQRPWDFWQYKSTGPVAGIGNPVDQDIANGDLEFVKDFLVPAMWTPDASGEWTTASNWNGVTKTPTALDRTIINRTAGNYTVTLSSGNQNVRSLQNGETLVINGGSLAIAQYLATTSASSNITLNNGTITSASFTNLAIFTQAGGAFTTGAVTNDNVTVTGNLIINGGTFKAASVRQNAVTIGNGTLQLTGNTASLVKSLVASGSGHLDLGEAKLVIDYTVFGDPTAAVRAALANGQIITSDTAGSGAALGVGYFVAGDLFTSFPATLDGLSLDQSSLILAPALKGDADLSGGVNFNDLVALAQSYNKAGRWKQGDFTYDGQVNFSDLVLLAQNYNATLSAVDPSALGASFAADWAMAQSFVPEPASALAIASLAAFTRRHRRNVPFAL